MKQSLIENRSIETDRVLRGALRNDLYRSLCNLRTESEKLQKFLDKAITYYWRQGFSESVEKRNRILDFMIYFDQLVPETNHIIDDLIAEFGELGFLEDDNNE